MRVVVMGQDGGVLLVVEGDGGVKEWSVFKGFAPDYSAYPFDQVGGIIGSKEETNGGVDSQQLPTGEADAMVAEVNGPGIIFA
jgi:hypothetical protein